MRTLTLIAGALLAPAAAAQSNSEGLFLGASMSVFVDGATVDAGGPMSPGQLYTKSVGYQPLVGEVPPASATLPDFRATTLFGGGNPVPFVVDAISTGLDPVAATTPAGGVSSVLLPADSWGQIAFSVSRDSQGLPGSVLRDEAGQPDGAGASIFTYMLPGSGDAFPSIADCYPSDRAQRALDAPQMGISDASPGEIGAMDFVMTLYRAGDPVLDILPDNPTVFFSVSRESVFPPGGGPGTVPAAWFGGPASRSGASILSTTWDPIAGSWSPPSVFLRYDELGLDQFDDLDALAVDEANCKALFSVTRDSAASLDEQLQVVDWCLEGGAETGTYQTTTQSVARAAEVDPDDEIDAVCGEDPGGQMSIDYGIVYGLPVGKALEPKFLDAAVFRDVAAPEPALTFVVENLPTGGPSRPLFFLVGLPGATGDDFMFVFDPIAVTTVGGGIPDTHHEFTVASPDLATLLDIPTALFFGVAGAGLPKTVSPTLVITL